MVEGRGNPDSCSLSGDTIRRPFHIPPFSRHCPIFTMSPSRFTEEIPQHLFDWRRLGTAQVGFASRAKARTEQAWRNTVGFGSKPNLPKPVPSVQPGDRVLHSVFGMGTVVATSGVGDLAKADVDFGSTGVKRLSLKHAPMEKL